MASDSPRSRSYREVSPDSLSNYPRAFTVNNPIPNPNDPPRLMKPEDVKVDIDPHENYPKPAFLAQMSIQHYPSALTPRYLPPLPPRLDYFGRPTNEKREDYPPLPLPPPPPPPPLVPPPQSQPQPSNANMNDAILAGGPAGPSQFAASPSVPRLPPILQVERQQVTSSATQMASASRRRNEALFACPVPNCGSTFTRRFNLRGHLRSHTEERPFVCGWPGCTKGFARSHDCKRHQALHQSKSSANACVGCKKTFSRTDALSRHLRSDGGAQCRAILEAENRSAINAAEQGRTAQRMRSREAQDLQNAEQELEHSRVRQADPSSNVDRNSDLPQAEESNVREHPGAQSGQAEYPRTQRRPQRGDEANFEHATLNDHQT